MSWKREASGLDPEAIHIDDVAPHVCSVYAIDPQAEIHEFHWEEGVPDTVEFVESDVADLPLTDGALDTAFSTMTYHELASDNAVAELARVLRSGGRLVVFDWSADGDGETGTPTDERFGAHDAAEALMAAGFKIFCVDTRTETFALVALAPRGQFRSGLFTER